jgi:hypothetical protein
MSGQTASISCHAAALANNNKIALFRSVGATGLGRTTHQCASITDELTSTPTTAGPCDRGAAIFLRRSWETHKVEVVTVKREND